MRIPMLLVVFALPVQAVQAQNNFQACEAQFQHAQDAIDAEKAAITALIGRLLQGDGWEFCESLVEPDAQSACMLEVLLIVEYYGLALDKLDEAKAKLTQAQRAWRQIVVIANREGVGNPRKNLNPIARKLIGHHALVFVYELYLTTQKLQRALIEEGLAQGQMSFMRIPGLHEPAGRIRTLFHIDTLFWLARYETCVYRQLSEVVTIVVANLWGRLFHNPPQEPPPLNGGNIVHGAGAGRIDALTAHPSFSGQTDTIDVSSATRLDAGGRVHRQIDVGFEIPADAVFDEDVVGSDGVVLARAGDPLSVFTKFDDDLGSFRYIDGRFESHGNPFSLMYIDHDNPGLVITCISEKFPLLVAGESDGCPLSLDVTGSPDEIASGATVSKSYTVLALGGNRMETDGNRYMKFHITLEAPMERPNDQCYVWDSASRRYVFDRSSDCLLGGGNTGGPLSSLSPVPDPISTTAHSVMSETH